MQKDQAEPILSAVFVDYDNVYLSLKRKSEEAAKRFAKDAYVWIKAIASGELVTPSNSFCNSIERRLVMNRCYGNPVPRRNTSDNATDMNSFAFVRHHFLRSGFEIIDCPPLTAQLKNSSDIRMVMDIRDFIDHKTNFDEFIIMSSDADFTPLLHRLRSYAKRTVIFTNDNTVAPYTALSDGEIREADLISHLLNDQVSMESRAVLPASEATSSLREQITDLVVQAVLESDTPVPMEVLAERSTRALGHEKTVGTNWAGAGSFREFLVASLPESIKLTDKAPYFAFEAARAPRMLEESKIPLKPLTGSGIPNQNGSPQESADTAAVTAPSVQSTMPHASTENTLSHGSPKNQSQPSEQPASAQNTSQSTGALDADDLQHSISRIHAACEAPPFSPPEYRAIFSLIEQEIHENKFQAFQTLQNVARRAADIGITISEQDARYVLDAITQGDVWLEKGVSATLFAERFRNYVVKQCKDHGLILSDAELDLIDAWFAATPKPDHELSESTNSAQSQKTAAPQTKSVSGGHLQPSHHQPVPSPQQQQSQPGQPGGPDWWRNGNDQAQSETQLQLQQPPAQRSLQTVTDGTTSQGDDFPRIVRNRLR